MCLQVEHVNDAVKERMERLSGHYTVLGIQRIARCASCRPGIVFPLISLHLFTWVTCSRTMDLAEIVEEKLSIPYADDEVEDQKGPRLGKRKGKFQVRLPQIVCFVRCSLSGSNTEGCGSHGGQSFK